MTFFDLLMIYFDGRSKATLILFSFGFHFHTISFAIPSLSTWLCPLQSFSSKGSCTKGLVSNANSIQWWGFEEMIES
jgi:hypothetical protein